MSKEKKCDNCQQSNNEGYYEIKKGGKVILNLCKKCINCHDCKKKEGEGLWNDKLYLCKSCMNKRQQNEDNHEDNSQNNNEKCGICKESWQIALSETSMVLSDDREDLAKCQDWEVKAKAELQKKVGKGQKEVTELEKKLSLGVCKSNNPNGHSYPSENYPLYFRSRRVGRTKWIVKLCPKCKKEDYEATIENDYGDSKTFPCCENCSQQRNNPSNNDNRERERERDSAITNSNCWTRSNYWPNTSTRTGTTK